MSDVAGVADGAAGAERRRLDDVADLDADVRAVAEDVLDAARLVVQAEDDFVDLRHLLEQIDLVVQKRPVEDRHDGLGVWSVSGRSRVPLPPASRMAFMTTDDHIPCG